VEATERVICIKRGVLESLGLDWTGKLLPAHDPSEPLFELPCNNVRRIGESQDIAQKVETWPAELRPVGLRSCQRTADDLSSLRRNIQTSNVGTIDRHAGGGFNERLLQVRPRYASRVAIF